MTASLSRRRRLLATLPLLAAAPLLITAPAAAAADAWPERPVRMVVPFPAGGGADVAARLFGEKLARELGQPVVIDNRPGASGNLGAEAVARAPADGYTLLFANEFLATNPAVFRSLRYDPLRDFVPVAKVASTAAAIAVHPSLPVRSLQELVALGRTRTLHYASPGVGTGPHLFGQLIALQTGAAFNHIPYKGSAPATADAVGGQVDFILSTLTPLVPHLAAGRLRGLAVTTDQRSPLAPDLPTVAETQVASLRYDIWYGVVAPAAVPRPVLARLQQASAQALRDAALQARLQSAGYETEVATPEAFGQQIRTDLERWTRVIHDAKIPRE